ncbi:TPA: type VI secretion protein, partial [Klebsiella pneumoniae]|nr:type VI secretion protein [Klebsiella pneumoniae]
MGWVRTKALTMEQPSAPSLTRWLFAGVLMAIIGVLLFILHASGTIETLSAMNIWWVSLAPAGCWLLAFCLRCWQWDRELKEYQFLQKEAERGQLKW